MYTFKRMKYMVCDLYINEVIKLKKEKTILCSSYYTMWHNKKK